MDGTERQSPNTTEVLILCGGLGTRLRPVIGENQKVLAKVSERPFLHILLDDLAGKGFRKFVLLTGHQRDDVRRSIEETYGKRTELSFAYSEEDSPLGTGGALKKALPLVDGDTFVVVNGDTFCDVSYQKFLSSHRANDAHLTIALVPSEREDGGNVLLDSAHRITAFTEKGNKTTDSYVNAGAYCMTKGIASFFPSDGIFSLEKDVFPRVVEAKQCFGFPSEESMLDIGTPERYQSAETFFNEEDTV